MHDRAMSAGTVIQRMTTNCASYGSCSNADPYEQRACLVRDAMVTIFSQFFTGSFRTCQFWTSVQTAPDKGGAAQESAPGACRSPGLSSGWLHPWPPIRPRANRSSVRTPNHDPDSDEDYRETLQAFDAAVMRDAHRSHFADAE